jgi:hypothetical protein
VPELRRHEQRRPPAESRGGFDVAAGVDQHLRQLDIAAPGRPVQRRHPVALRGVDVHALLQQRPDGVAVARHGRIRDACVVR